MSLKWFSTSKLSQYPSISSNPIRMIFNTSYQTNFNGTKLTTRRWINGIIIGSIPFLIILLCWMFVSLCINNLVRIYHYKKYRIRSDRQQNEFNNNNTSKVNV